MTEYPLASIIIPTWNAGRYVAEAVDSALAQTYPNCEVIVVDDGSTDSTKAVLEPYTSAKKIIYIYQKNGGLSTARNAGIRASRGAYIALLDSDDIFLSEKIAEQVQYLETHPDCDVSYCDLYHFWDGESELLKLNYHYYSGADVLPHLIEASFIAPLSVVFRRSVFERFGYFDENLWRSEDLNFWFRIAHGGARIDFLPKILAKLRMRKIENLQGVESQPQVKTTMLEVLTRLDNAMTREEHIRYDMDYHLARYRRNIGIAYLMNAKKTEAKPYLLAGDSMGRMLWFMGALLPATIIQKLLVKFYYIRRSHRLEPA